MYHWRFADMTLTQRLSSAGAVLIQGVKGSGKTETALQQAASMVQMDISTTVKYQMEVDPNLVLNGDVPRLIDEWQVYPEIWNHVRHEVDARKGKGQFILTGSSTALDSPRLHSGAGRISPMSMRPMSSHERGWSTGVLSLYGLLHGEQPTCDEVSFNLDTLVERLIIGGWPGLLSSDVHDGVRHGRDYISIIAEVDLQSASQRRHDPLKVMRLLQSYARNISTEASMATLSMDTAGSDHSVTDETVAVYLDTLRRLFIIEDLPAWNVHIRSSQFLRKGVKRHFVDPSLAIGALGLSVDALKKDLQYTGFLFESMVIRDLRIYAEQHDGKVYHYRDSQALEVDAIIEFADGTWAAFEIKMGFRAQDEGALNLLKLADRIDYTKREKPALLAVITANGFAYRREDGVAVIPIGVLTA